MSYPPEYTQYCCDCLQVEVFETRQTLCSAGWKTTDKAHLTVLPFLIAVQALATNGGIEAQHWARHVNLSWARIHINHTLRIRDEYGHYHEVKSREFTRDDEAKE